MQSRKFALAVTATVVSGIAVVLLILLSGSSSPLSGSSEAFSTDGGYPNIDASNTRWAKSSIDGSTVADLSAAWSLPITAPDGFYGRYLASPVVMDGVVYSQDQASDVQAISLASGKLLWEKSYKAPIAGRNGVIAVNGYVYGATPSKAFALDAKTGEEIWSTHLRRNESEQISMAPGYRAGSVFVSTEPAGFKGGEAGVLWALDGKTGKKKWRFDTVPDDLWGHPDLNFGGGLNYTPAFDDRGYMYISVGIPGPAPGTKSHPWGLSRPGPNLYTNSVVKLDAETGKLQWYYQLTPHSLCDWALGPPILVTADGRSLVIVAGKSGIVVAVDRQTGELVWKRPVGIHNGHDNDGLIAMKGEYSKLKTPMTVYPGRYGGVPAPLSAGMSTIFVPVVNLATKLFSQIDVEDKASAGGELVALDAATGSVKWKQELPAPPLGATVTTNDLVFASTADGTVYAFDSESGSEVWSISLPVGIYADLTVADDTLLAPAGYAEGKKVPRLFAYSLPN
jgi:alcohol dehydrogenase (cytochrome c)